jgi:hypothetical protein
MINLRVDTTSVKSMFESVRDLEADIITEAHRYFKSITPIRTGNARRNTFKTADGVDANYPYAARLDEGYSRQAPRGMSDPTIAYMEQVFDKLVADAEK